MINHPVVSQEEWTTARKELLEKEKAFTQIREQLARQVRELPWVKIEKEYQFDGPDGKQSLVELFAGSSQLIIYHFMFDPEWTEGCKACSFLADNYDPSIIHLKYRDVSMVTVSRAPLEVLQSFQKRMGWSFDWYSSFESDFNHDFHVTFTEEALEAGEAYYNYQYEKPFPVKEAPGISVFYKDQKGEIYHTYSSYARGLDRFIGTYHLLDIVPKGRDESALPYSMNWVRHHDRYDDDSFVDPYVDLVSKPPK